MRGCRSSPAHWRSGSTSWTSPSRSTTSAARARWWCSRVLTVADFVGDKIPAVDYVLHAAGVVVAPVSGAALFTGQTGSDTDLPTLVAVALGGSVAGVHPRGPGHDQADLDRRHRRGWQTRSSRSSRTSARWCLTLAAFIVPVLAALAVLALAVLIVIAARRARGRAPS